MNFQEKAKEILEELRVADNGNLFIQSLEKFLKEAHEDGKQEVRSEPSRYTSEYDQGYVRGFQRGTYTGLGWAARHVEDYTVSNHFVREHPEHPIGKHIAEKLKEEQKAWL